MLTLLQELMRSSSFTNIQSVIIENTESHSPQGISFVRGVPSKSSLCGLDRIPATNVQTTTPTKALLTSLSFSEKKYSWPVASAKAGSRLLLTRVHSRIIALSLMWEIISLKAKIKLRVMILQQIKP